MPLDQVDVDQEPVNNGAEMSFFDHIDALRWHIIRSVICIFLVGIIIFLNKDFVFNQIIFGPRHEDFITYKIFCSFGDWLCIKPTHFDVITRDLGEKFTCHITVSFFLGLVIAFPYVFWELWRFIRPGLYITERSSINGVVLICSVLFTIGVLFGYFLIAPFALSFLAGYELADTLSTPTLNSYVNYMIMFTIPIGCVFELPMVSFFLTKIGLISSDFLKSTRRYAIVILLLLAGLLTPSPDVVSQLILFTPLYCLYEASIIVSIREEARQRKIEQKWDDENINKPPKT